MKTLQTCSLLLLCALFSSISFGQTIPINEPDYNKAKLFQDLPDRLPVEVSSLQNLLNLQIGQQANFQLTNSEGIQGPVVSSALKYNTIQSIVIRSTNRAGANFSFSKISLADGSVKYTGRIISRQHSDGFELSEENGKYFLVKKHFYDMMNE